MIHPHGDPNQRLKPLFVKNSQHRYKLLEEANTLPSLIINSAAAANAAIWKEGPSSLKKLKRQSSDTGGAN